MSCSFYRYRQTQPINLNENPLTWWRDHQTSFPLFAQFYEANAAFQATSVASERICNVDKLVG